MLYFGGVRRRVGSNSESETGFILPYGTKSKGRAHTRCNCVHITRTRCHWLLAQHPFLILGPRCTAVDACENQVGEGGEGRHGDQEAGGKLAEKVLPSRDSVTLHHLARGKTAVGSRHVGLSIFMDLGVRDHTNAL